MGVAIEPRLAAAVSSTIVRIATSGIPRKSARVSGTSVNSDTSFVTSIARKKHIVTSAAPSDRVLWNRFVSAPESLVNAPMLPNPCTAAIRQNSSPSVDQSTYPRYPASGGVNIIEMSAAASAMHSTVSFFMNSDILLI